MLSPPAPHRDRRRPHNNRAASDNYQSHRGWLDADVPLTGALGRFGGASQSARTAQGAFDPPPRMRAEWPRISVPVTHPGNACVLSAPGTPMSAPASTNPNRYFFEQDLNESLYGVPHNPFRVNADLAPPPVTVAAVQRFVPAVARLVKPLPARALSSAARFPATVEPTSNATSRPVDDAEERGYQTAAWELALRDGAPTRRLSLLYWRGPLTPAARAAYARCAQAAWLRTDPLWYTAAARARRDAECVRPHGSTNSSFSA